MKTNPHEMVHPNTSMIGCVGQSQGGLTKREYFAAAALQGLCVSFESTNPKACADMAVKQADALIKRLNQEESNG